MAARTRSSDFGPLAPRAPGAAANSAAEVDTTTAKDRLVAGKPVIRLGNVSTPTLTVYSPKQKNTGAAIVVFPGGAYHILAIDLEGTEVCDWLNSVGITCVLVKYRVPDSGPYPNHRPHYRTHNARSALSGRTRRSGTLIRRDRSTRILRRCPSFCGAQHALRAAALRSYR